MQFRVKDFEELEDKEDWQDIFLLVRMQFRAITGEISGAYAKIGLDNSVWERITKKMKYVDGVYSVEFDWKWVKNKLIPNIKKGLGKMENNEEKIGGFAKFIVISLKDILKIANTCVKYKKPMEITI